MHKIIEPINLEVVNSLEYTLPYVKTKYNTKTMNNMQYYTDEPITFCDASYMTVQTIGVYNTSVTRWCEYLLNIKSSTRNTLFLLIGDTMGCVSDIIRHRFPNNNNYTYIVSNDAYITQTSERNTAACRLCNNNTCQDGYSLNRDNDKIQMGQIKEGDNSWLPTIVKTLIKLLKLDQVIIINDANDINIYNDVYLLNVMFRHVEQIRRLSPSTKILCASRLTFKFNEVHKVRNGRTTYRSKLPTIELPDYKVKLSVMKTNPVCALSEKYNGILHFDASIPSTRFSLDVGTVCYAMKEASRYSFLNIYTAIRRCYLDTGLIDVGGTRYINMAQPSNYDAQDANIFLTVNSLHECFANSMSRRMLNELLMALKSDQLTGSRRNVIRRWRNNIERSIEDILLHIRNNEECQLNLYKECYKGNAIVKRKLDKLPTRHRYSIISAIKESIITKSDIGKAGGTMRQCWYNDSDDDDMAVLNDLLTVVNKNHKKYRKTVPLFPRLVNRATYIPQSLLICALIDYTIRTACDTDEQQSASDTTT